MEDQVLSMYYERVGEGLSDFQAVCQVAEELELSIEYVERTVYSDYSY
jgi:hypothetical protein